jgi:hypothetical protein
MSAPFAERPLRAWGALAREQRLAAACALGLFASMFLPWYSKTDTLVVRGTARATETSLTAFQAFSFVEAAVLLVSAGVLSMLFARAEDRAFGLPGGDGLIVLVAGGWSALLVFYRMVDKPGLQGNARVTATVGVEWGIFVALLLALALCYAGGRMRAGERPQPPLRRRRGATAQHAGDARAAAEDPAARQPPDPRERRPAVVGPVAVRAPEPARGRYPPAPAKPAPSARGEQLSFDDQPTRTQHGG